MKRCYRCGLDKPISEFYRNASKSDGLTTECKPCKYLQVRESISRNPARDRESKTRWSNAIYRTPAGWVNTVYCSMRLHSKRRGHPPPTIMRADLERIVSTPEFKELLAAWKDSGFAKSFKPSLDRLDESRHYTLDNIRLTTWQENHGAYARSDKNRRFISALQPKASALFVENCRKRREEKGGAQ